MTYGFGTGLSKKRKGRPRADIQRRDKPEVLFVRYNPNGWRSCEKGFKVQACCYLGPRSALVYSSSVSPSSVMLVPTNHNPGYTSQCILQVALVDPINEHQQIIGIVKELSSIDCGADQPFLTVTGQRFGANVEDLAGRIGRQEERFVALTAQVFKQQQALTQKEIRLDETFELFGGYKPIDPGTLFGFHG